MKKILLSFLLTICVTIAVNAQTTFNLNQTVTLSGAADPYAIATGLLNDDAFADIVYASSGNGTFSILFNDASDPGNFLTPVPLGTGGYGYPNSVAIADIDGINGNDIIVSTGLKAIWFPNDGTGGYSTGLLVADFPSYGASFVVVKDIDDNGTLDIAVSDFYNHELVWMSNLGSDTPTPRFDGSKNIIVNGFTNVAGFDLGDIDGDGDIDAVVSNAVGSNPGDSRIEVYYNNGLEVFIADADPMDVDDDDKAYIWSVMLADVDEDSNLDIVSSDLYGSLEWYKRTETAPGVANYVGTTITTSIVNPATIAFEDLDNDSKKDIVLSSGTSGIPGNDIVWFKNNGSGAFGSENVIDATQSQAYTMAFADFDNDMDLDIASAAYNSDTIKMFDNQRFVLSIDNPTMENQFSFYPNPVKNTINFNGLTENSNISVYDILGKNVLTSNVNMNQSLDVSNLNKGMYILKFEGNNSVFKFVKK